MMRPIPPAPHTLRNRLRFAARDAAGAVIRRTWELMTNFGGMSPTSAAARQFGSFGVGSIVCFPHGPHMNTRHIHLGDHVLVAPDVTLSAGWSPEHRGLPDEVVTIGDRSLIGRGSTIIGHRRITIGADVWTGHHVHITDMNHGYEDVDLPISVQHQPEAPIAIGDGSWLGHGVVVLPGAQIGKHVVVGAGSVVVGDLPDFCVAVGVPARVIRTHVSGDGWVDVVRDARTDAVVADFRGAAPGVEPDSLLGRGRPASVAGR
jgi:acetyltransferase-like isoleucine patch superfamily enzyme